MASAHSKTRHFAWLLALLLGCASAAPSRERSVEITEWRFATLTVEEGADRALSQLDVDGNGTVNDGDVEALERLARAARDELAGRGLSRDFDLFYPGPANDDDPVFTRVIRQGREFDLASIAKESELRELAVEAQWAARQARLAALGDGSAARVRDLGARWFTAFGDESHAPADLCETLPALDSSAFDDAKIERVVVLDLDDTIWSGNVIDPFLAVLLEDRLIREDAHPRLKAFLKTVNGIDPEIVDANDVIENAELFRKHTIDDSLPDGHRINAKDGFFETSALLNGLSRAEVLEAARKATEVGALGAKGIPERIFAAEGCSMAQLIDRLQTAGFEVYLLSATLDVLAFAAADVLGVPRDKTVGSPLAVEDDRYTGEVVLSTYTMKGSIARAWLPSPPLVVFGDSATSDVPMMLEAYGIAFMVNPDEQMIEKDATEAEGRFVALEFPLPEERP